MARSIDGPASSNFAPILLTGGRQLAEVAKQLVSDRLLTALKDAPRGDCVCWGIPFSVGEPIVVADSAVELEAPTSAEWLVFLHASDLRPPVEWGAGPYQPPTGEGRLGEHAADYVVLYADGREERLAIRRRRQVGAFSRLWGENCFEAVAHRKPCPMRAHHEQMNPDWGRSQTRVTAADASLWVWWLWAWQNPRPGSAIRGLRLEPVEGTILLGAVTAGSASSHPLRWRSRRKAILSLDEAFDLALDDAGLLRQVRLDFGQVISAAPQPSYGDDAWEAGTTTEFPRSTRRASCWNTRRTRTRGSTSPMGPRSRWPRWRARRLSGRAPGRPLRSLPACVPCRAPKNASPSGWSSAAAEIPCR